MPNAQIVFETKLITVTVTHEDLENKRIWDIQTKNIKICDIDQLTEELQKIKTLQAMYGYQG